MNGYSKMRANTNFTSKSRSMDFSNLNFSPPQAQEDPNPTSKPQQDKTHDLFSLEEGEGERFGVILSRNGSSASQRFRGNEKSNGSSTTLQDVVRRAFSMRKSSSVGDGYWRIHDTGDGEVILEEEEGRRTSRKKRGKIFRACKRLFKF